MASDHERSQLYLALSEHLGRGPADTMMDLLPPMGWADLARRSDVDLVRGEVRSLRAELRGEIDAFRGEVHGQIGSLRGEIDSFRGEVHGEIGSLRGEIGSLRGEVRAVLPRLVAANLASMLGVAGLVLAAARLA